MTRRNRILVAAVAAGLLLVTGLFVLVTSRSDGPPSAVGDFPVTMVDDAGTTVTVTAAPQRIVSLAPHITETLFALGAGERIVGVAAGETHPPAASTLPRVVADDGLTPDPNAIVQARPDLVLTATTGDWIEPLRTAGFPVITLTASDVGDALKDMRSIGRLTGEGQAASELVSETRQGIRAVRSASTPNQVAPKVFVEVFSEPLMGAASESFVGSLVMAAGGKAVPESGDPYPGVGLDQLNELDPDIYLAAASSAVTIERITARPGFSGLRAVREQRVHLISDELLFRPGPRMVEGLEAIASIIRETEPA
ncbi:MAG: helical backbone metal receptor [Actinobacteria bacterium]|nr:helical backbone metal receptor [Actinomycetota bacterium]